MISAWLAMGRVNIHQSMNGMGSTLCRLDYDFLVVVVMREFEVPGYLIVRDRAIAVHITDIVLLVFHDYLDIFQRFWRSLPDLIP